MARRSGRTPTDRTPSDPLGAILASYSPPRISSPWATWALVKAMEDRRRFHPLGMFAPAAAVSRSSRRLTPGTGQAGKLTRGLAPPPGLSFSVPRDVAVCVRRKERREVIFAQRKAGKGARSPRRRSRFSDIGCS